MTMTEINTLVTKAKEDAIQIKKLKAMVFTLQRQLHNDTLRYKRLVFDHNGLKHEVSALKHKLG